MFFKQMTQEEDGRFVWRTIRHVQTDELASRDVLVEEVLHLSAQVVRNLKQMDAKHQFEIVRLTTGAAAFKIERPDQIQEFAPRDQFVEPFGEAPLVLSRR